MESFFFNRWGEWVLLSKYMNKLVRFDYSFVLPPPLTADTPLIIISRLQEWGGHTFHKRLVPEINTIEAK